MAPREPAPLERLAEAMEQRRRALDITWEDVHAAGGPAVRTLNNLRRAQSAPDRATLAKLDTALRWQPGSAKAVLSGAAEPVPLDGAAQEAPSLRGDGDWRTEAISAGYTVTEITRAAQRVGGILEAWTALPATTFPDQAGDRLFPGSPVLAAAWNAGWAASPVQDPAARAEQVAWIVALGDARRGAGQPTARGALTLRPVTKR
jgi:hypothetical protein